ncbi:MULTISPECIES: glycosyl hydrolase 53 family protein [Frigoribacterium]|uniref:glycoside hydrolase family 53 protein n=1 Tax=Frigoribacterium TaxID=96492 RepID=UPI0012F206F2|nr:MULTISPECIES: glycosyl hydrolase 53 family protein [Frigoribacterium]VXA97570.1 Arabinogalactan endo-beta-1,4-galactanase [Frigoribacterium sp. 9N]
MTRPTTTPRPPVDQRGRRGLAVGAALATAALGAGLLSGTPATAVPGGPAPRPVVVQDPGFEHGATGWVSKGSGTTTLEAGGHDSATRLTHVLSTAGTATTSQKLKKVTPGWWTFSAWVKSGGGLASSTLSLTGCGTGSSKDAAATTVIPSTESDDGWLRLSVSAEVTHSQCTPTFTTSGAAGAWASIDDVTVTPGRVTRDVRGADLSGLPRNEDRGAVYLDAAGRPTDPVTQLADHGANMVRLKVWVDPTDGYNDQDDVVAMAARVKAAGMQLLVDFHYSDRWTDPGAQTMPRDWLGLSAPEVATRIHDHTRSVLDALAAEGITADAVQVGNEINPGMVWPLGQTWDVDPSDGVSGAQWSNLAMFLTAGATAVKEVSPTTQVVLHLTNINAGVDGLTWWFDEATSRGVPFDLIGLSYYGYWHGGLSGMQQAVTTLSERYDRDVLIVETSYPWTLEDDPDHLWENVVVDPSQLVAGYPATPEGQAANFRAIQDVVASAPGGRGIGVVAWEPAWTAVDGAGWDPDDPTSGNAWENQAMWDHDGRPLPALDEYAAD